MISKCTTGCPTLVLSSADGPLLDPGRPPKSSRRDVGDQGSTMPCASAMRLWTTPAAAVDPAATALATDGMTPPASPAAKTPGTLVAPIPATATASAASGPGGARSTPRAAARALRWCSVTGTSIPAQRLRVRGVELGRPVGEQGDVVAPHRQQQRAVRPAGPPVEHAQGLLPDLPPMTERAVEDRPPPSLLDARQVRAAVVHAGRQQHPARRLGGAVAERQDEGVLVAPAPDDLAGAHLHGRIGGQLGPAGRVELGGRATVLAQQAPDPGSDRVARPPAVDHERAPPRPPQHERRAESGSATSDHDAVPCRFHAAHDADSRRVCQHRLPCRQSRPTRQSTPGSGDGSGSCAPSRDSHSSRSRNGPTSTSPPSVDSRPASVASPSTTYPASPPPSGSPPTTSSTSHCPTTPACR